MNPKYRSLFEPFKINNLEIKNKFFMPAMGIPSIDEHGVYTQDAIEYYVTRAKGGIGLIITGANWVENNVEKHAKRVFPSPTTDPGAYKLAAMEMTDRIHAYGGKIFVQLTAGLGRSAVPHWIDGTDYVAPSATTNRWDPSKPCRELTTEEVEEIVAGFAKSAKVVQEAGFDGVEVHAVHEGYLLDCFSMSLFNQRTDKYGGDLRGRLRFATEIVAAIKEACGQDFPVILRFSVKSYVKALRQGGLPGEEFEELGRDIDEALEAAKIFQEAGYDAFDADAGTYDSWYWSHPPMYFDKGMYLPLSEQLKKVATIPVMVAGRMDDPDMMIDALNTGKLDAIGLGRPVLADPDYPLKLKNDDIKDIRPCLGCHDGCIGRKLAGGRGSCAVNPECNRELEVGIVPALESKNVVVVGGGPAGMEAARVSALRGHKVTLFESSSRIGGQLNFAGVPDFKQDDISLIEWYEYQLEKLHVDVKLNTKATKETIAELHPDAVYIAEGSSPIKLNLPGMDSEKVVNAQDVLGGKTTVGKNCTIVGGGLVGCELALHLSKQGHNVTIVEALDDILKAGIPMVPANEWMLRDLLTFNNVEILTKTGLTAVNEEGAVVKSGTEEKTVPADNVIMAIGFRSTASLYNELRTEYTQIYNLGDGQKVRNIRAAIWDAYEVARTI